MTTEEFDALPIERQRVVIAQDLIERLNAKKFIAEARTYFEAPLNSRDPDVQIRDAIAGVECRGCQIGGLFACAIDLHNALRIGDVQVFGRIRNTVHDDSMRDYLTPWFSRQTLAELEEAFEGCGNFEEWANETPDDEGRMRLIAQNIIVNNGEFIPAQLLNAPATP